MELVLVSNKEIIKNELVKYISEDVIEDIINSYLYVPLRINNINEDIKALRYLEFFNYPSWIKFYKPEYNDFLEPNDYIRGALRIYHIHKIFLNIGCNINHCEYCISYINENLFNIVRIKINGTCIMCDKRYYPTYLKTNVIHYPYVKEEEEYWLD